MIVSLRIISLLAALYGTARLFLNYGTILSRGGWYNFIIAGAFLFLLTVLIEQLRPGRRLQLSASGRLPATGTIIASVRNGRSRVRKVTISRRTEGWLVELFDERGDFVGKGEAPAFTGLAGPSSFLLTDSRGNSVGTCDVKTSAGIVELVTHDRDGALLARGRFQARQYRVPSRVPWQGPSRTHGAA